MYCLNIPLGAQFSGCTHFFHFFHNLCLSHHLGNLDIFVSLVSSHYTCMCKNIYLLVFRIMYLLVLVVVVCWVALDTAQRGTRQLVSFSGLLLLIFSMLLFSKHPFRVRNARIFSTKSIKTLLTQTGTRLLQWSWQTLLCGIGLQFTFGVLILRTTSGLSVVKWLGNLVEVHMNFQNKSK